MSNLVDTIKDDLVAFEEKVESVATEVAIETNGEHDKHAHRGHEGVEGINGVRRQALLIRVTKST